MMYSNSNGKSLLIENHSLKKKLQDSEARWREECGKLNKEIDRLRALDSNNYWKQQYDKCREENDALILKLNSNRSFKRSEMASKQINDISHLEVG